MRKVCFVLVFVGALLTVAKTAGAACVTNTQLLFDGTSCTTNGREACATGRLYHFGRWSYGGQKYLLGSTYTSINFYNVTNPTNPSATFIPGSYQPWGYPEGSPDDDEEQWDAAMLDDYPYGLAMFQNFGWAAFGFTNPNNIANSSFQLIHRYRSKDTGGFLSTTDPSRFARLFRASDGLVYAVGAYLNQSDSTVSVASFNDGTANGPPSNIIVKSRMSGITAGDPMELVVGPGSVPYLIVLHNSASVDIYNMSNPNAPSQTTTVATGNIYDMYLDPDSRRLYVLKAPGSSVVVYNVANPPSWSTVATVTMSGGFYASVVAGAGDLVVASPGGTAAARAYSIANPAAPVEIAAGELALSAHSNEGVLDLALIQASSGDYEYFRAAFSVLTASQISASCLSTNPRPAFSVSGGSSQATCTGGPTSPSTAVAGRGFPGDTFTINDTSSGQIATKVLTIYPVGQPQSPVFSSSWGPTNGWSPALAWATPGTQLPGEYIVFLDETDSASTHYTLYQSIVVCANPHAALAFTVGSAGVLLNDPVNVSAAGSGGHPTSYSFFVVDPSTASTPLAANGATLASNYLPAALGNYTIGVVAQYAFVSANDSACTTDFTSYLGANYNSCALLSFSAGYGVSSFEVWQNSTKIADAATAGALIVGQPTTLKFTGKVATGDVPNLEWNLPGIAAQDIACSYTGAPSYTGTTCAIAANKFTSSAQPIHLNMSLQVCPTGGSPGVDCSSSGQLAVIPAAQVTVTPTTNSFAFAASPQGGAVAVGQTITVQISQISGSFSGLVISYGGMACDGTSQKGLICGGFTNDCYVGKSITFSYAQTGNFTLSGLGDGTVPASGSYAFNVGAGSCPGSGTQTVTLSASPNPGTTNQTVTFGLTPALPTVNDVYNVSFGDGGSQQVRGPCSIACSASHAYTYASTFAVSVNGTYQGNTASGSMSLTVNTPGSGGSSVTIAANPNPGTVGQSVTFTLTPYLTSANDYVTVQFGDGASSTVHYYDCVGGTLCPAITHTYASAATFTVSASGVLVGSSRTGTLSLVVSPPACGQSAVPTPSFTWLPTSPLTGQTVTFTDQSTNSPTAWAWDFGDGSNTTITSPCPLGICTPTHTYTAATTYTVSMIAVNCKGGSTIKQQQITVQSPCQLPAAPTPNFTWSPTQPRVGQVVQFTDLSTGTVQSYSWSFAWALGQLGSSAAQNPTFSFSAPGTYTIILTVNNCKGSNVTQKALAVLPACDQQGPPNPDFSVSPSGPTQINGVTQPQPYVGQTVTLTDTSTGSPTAWSWYDFGGGTIQGALPLTTNSVTVTWNDPCSDPNGCPKIVKMTSTNCIGPSVEKLKQVLVYPDIRPVKADFTWTPTSPQTGQTITFNAVTGAPAGNPTTFVWTFDDGTPQQTGPTVTHSYTCKHNAQVTLTVSRGTFSDAKPQTLAVDGYQCGPESVVAVDAAKTPGLNGTNWQTDIRIFNPDSRATQVWIAVLPVGRDNATPFEAGPFTLVPKGTLVLNNILLTFSQLGVSVTKAALRVRYQNDNNTAPIMTSRTYTPAPGSGTYGQFVAGVPVDPNDASPTPVWITGLRNNGLDSGFRTNFSLQNLRGTAGGVSNIVGTLYDTTGAMLATRTFGLAPYGYLQDSIANLFGASLGTVGDFAMRLDIPKGMFVQGYASVVDNLTGDPVLIPAEPMAGSPIYLPGVGHLPGENDTIWRADLEITNSDAVAHIWELMFTPKGNASGAFRNISLGPNSTLSVSDVVGWVYGLPVAPQLSGVVKIFPVDGSNVYPIVAARSYNQTAAGTFGQAILPVLSSMGITQTTPNKRLLLTGMSSEDLGRTNVGFVNVSETSSVDFSVLFYDRDGALLNPGGAPYTIGVALGGWDQDKLENRFRNFFHSVLPTGLDGISAEVTVRAGGPGFVYATVIDPMTGDPNFIPGLLAP